MVASVGRESRLGPHDRAERKKHGRSIQVPYSRFGPQSDRSQTIGIAVGFDKDRVAFSEV